MSDLRSPPPGQPGKTPSKLSSFFHSHPAALAKLDEWLELRAMGETPYSIRDIIVRLQQPDCGMPAGFVGPSGLRGWLERHRLEIYLRGKK